MIFGGYHNKKWKSNMIISKSKTPTKASISLSEMPAHGWHQIKSGKVSSIYTAGNGGGFYVVWGHGNKPGSPCSQAQAQYITPNVTCRLSHKKSDLIWICITGRTL